MLNQASMEKQTSKKLFKYKEQHAVIVKVADEKEQQKVYEMLRKIGFTDLKIVSV